MSCEINFQLEIISDTHATLGVDDPVSKDKLIAYAEKGDLPELAELLSEGPILSKWRRHDADMRQLSLAFPGVLFKLSGDGEEDLDYWASYFIDGKTYTCQPKITIKWPKFDPTLLR